MAEFFVIAAVVSCFKLLLLKSYRSTDFEVHRNWLAITHSLPVSKWYYESTSEWTLDYPPLFAWLEFCLSQVAKYFDPEMLKVENLNYASEMTILFQRLSVIITDFVFIYAVKEFCSTCISARKRSADPDDIFHSPRLIMYVCLIANFGLIIVDHIHFQYNGFLSGLLLLSITRIYQERNLEGAFWFAVLLNLKHIYLFVAPAYFVYLLRCYCFQNHADGRIRWGSFSPVRLISLGIIVLSVFAVSFGPFIHMGQLLQLLSRLFPVKRGLCHAYWAPNFWVLYNVADKAATVTVSKFNLLAIESNHTAVMTGGLVQEYDHVVLPSITPFITLVVTLLAIMPSLFLLWSRPRGPASFVRALVLCAFGSFMFSWHVHEKAILLIILPLSLLMLYKKKDAQLFLVISTVGHYSLFPLLYRQQEIPIKVCLLLIYTLYIYAGLGKMFGFSWSWSSLPLLSQAESLYILGLVPLELYNNIIHSALGLSERLPFLPLLLTSFYCAVGVTYSWIKFYWLTFQEKPRKTEGKMQ